MIDAMVDGILRSPQPITLVEAGTGTGKTVVYLTVALSLLRQIWTDAKIVIITNTVALQDQLMRGELPQLAEIEPFTYSAAKGRQRYVCTFRVHEHLQRSEFDLQLEEDADEPFSSRCRKVLNVLEQHSWDGDMDNSPIPLSASERAKISTDALGCLGVSCRFFDACPYFQKRETWSTNDVVVTNYDLWLLDLENERGILPHPSESIYVLDEAHNLLTKFMRTNGSSTSISTLLELSEEMASHFENFSKQWKARDLKPFDAAVVDHDLEQIQNHATRSVRVFDQLDWEKDSNMVRFPSGIVDDRVRDVLEPIKNAFRRIVAYMTSIHDRVSEVTEGERQWVPLSYAQKYREAYGECVTTGLSILKVLEDWCKHDTSGIKARWLHKSKGDKDPNGIHLYYVPIAVDVLMADSLWGVCKAITCVSATLGGHDDFAALKVDLGLDSRVKSTKIPSPFDPRHVRLRCPPMGTEPPDGTRYISELAKKLPQWLNDHHTALVIFTSHIALNGTWERLEEKFRKTCLKQSDFASGELLLQEHRARVSSKQASYIFGLASFREGVDLPGVLCEQVVVAQLPFPVPSDPVLKSRKERMFPDDPKSYKTWLHFDFAEAATLLAQTCGRLIRSESDTGTLTIADKRFVKKGYATKMQKLLPYQLETRSKDFN